MPAEIYWYFRLQINWFCRVKY